MGWFSNFFGRDEEKEELVRWIMDHNNYAYMGVVPRHSYPFSTYYDTYDTPELERIKSEIQGIHQSYEYRKAHPKPKIGDVYSVYLCGKCVDTLRNVTNVSHNENGAFFTITLEDGTTRLKSYFGSGNIHWCKEG